MRGIVVLDIARWRKRYPQYDNLSDEQIEDLFVSAMDYLENTLQCVIDDLDKRQRALYYLMAHLAYIFYQDANGSGGTGLIGRVSSATEGSVSVSSGLASASPSEEFFRQSPFGWAFWNMTKVYRMGIWFGGRPYCCSRNYF